MARRRTPAQDPDQIVGDNGAMATISFGDGGIGELQSRYGLLAQRT